MKKIIKNNPYKLSVIWALIILGLCSMPGRFIPTVSWLELISFDKWVHAGIFFILVSLLSLGVLIHKQNTFLIIVFCILCIIYGGLLEIMQAKLFSQRSADWQDFVANSFGCLMAFAFYKKITTVILK